MLKTPVLPEAKLGFLDSLKQDFGPAFSSFRKSDKDTLRV